MLATLDTLDDTKARTLRNTLLLQHILAFRPSIGGRSITMSLPLCQLACTHVRRAPPRLPVGNPDIDVLRPEILNPTHVTPRIAALATDLFREQLSAGSCLRHVRVGARARVLARGRKAPWFAPSGWPFVQRARRKLRRL